jgi:hypothetical protein
MNCRLPIIDLSKFMTGSFFQEMGEIPFRHFMPVFIELTITRPGFVISP